LGGSATNNNMDKNITMSRRVRLNPRFEFGI
jgi:hypothetical protein